MDMMFNLWLVSAAFGVSSQAAQSEGHSLRLPIRSRGSSALGSRDGPEYGNHPLRANATQKHYLSPYTVELTIGSPPQLVYPAIDLFATNVWVNPDCYAAYDYKACCKNGDYNPDASTSAEEQDCSQGWGFSTPYGDASGCNVVDDVQFAGTDLGDITVGVANASWAQTAGRLGLGFGCDEGDTSILDLLKSLDVIATRQFSIALGSANPNAEDLQESTDVGLGELLFSGINTRKYTGELRKLHSRPGPDDDPRYYITLTSISFSDLFNCESFDGFPPPRRAYLDYTTIISYFPAEYIDILTGFFPYVNYNLTAGMYQLPCYHRALDASVDFYFGSLPIRVPLHDFIMQVDGICFLGLQQSVSDNEVILGQSFLRGAYTAFDLDDEAIYMAQYENCGDQVIDWDSSASDEDGLCAAKPTTFPASSLPQHPALRHRPPGTQPQNIQPGRRVTRLPQRATPQITTPLVPRHIPPQAPEPVRQHRVQRRRAPARLRHITAQSRPRRLQARTAQQRKRHRRKRAPPDPQSLPGRGDIPQHHRHPHCHQAYLRASASAHPHSGRQITAQGYHGAMSRSRRRRAAPGTEPPQDLLPPSTFLPTVDYATETSTLTSVPASTSSTSTRGRTSSVSIEDSAEKKTVTVTVGVLTSTVYMPSPITIPMSTCDCAGTPMLGHEEEEVGGVEEDVM
ncbi:hypothetical protein NPX13_g2456 [Xylaria arbuscula]|uniref:Peptidase A1 domain-containing protein n=1 Tax=Xylaria arbuscula TaxID=114810 RepID=A0A9W8TP57_9PEZI|nr:hypothetical protein NPX13_g2456 [Xylaria arbuscula]